jgi:hypothetical protein
MRRKSAKPGLSFRLELLNSSSCIIFLLLYLTSPLCHPPRQFSLCISLTLSIPPGSLPPPSPSIKDRPHSPHPSKANIIPKFENHLAQPTLFHLTTLCEVEPKRIMRFRTFPTRLPQSPSPINKYIITTTRTTSTVHSPSPFYYSAKLQLSLSPSKTQSQRTFHQESTPTRRPAQPYLHSKLPSYLRRQHSFSSTAAPSHLIALAIFRDQAHTNSSLSFPQTKRYITTSISPLPTRSSNQLQLRHYSRTPILNTTMSATTATRPSSVPMPMPVPFAATKAAQADARDMMTPPLTPKAQDGQQLGE